MFRITDTKREQEEVLEQAGVTGEAREFLLRATAPHRHNVRVEATLACARRMAQGDTAAAAALLLADIVGIGGPQNEAAGLGTSRLAGFGGLGKGRKQASDGPAWMSAAEAALMRLYDMRRGGRLEIEAVGTRAEGDESFLGGAQVRVRVVQPADDGEGWTDFDVLSEATEVRLPVEWLRALVIHGFRRATGVGARDDVPGLWLGEVWAWAAAYNAVVARVEKARSAERTVGGILPSIRAAGPCDAGLEWAEAHADMTLAEAAEAQPEWAAWAKRAGVLG